MNCPVCHSRLFTRLSAPRRLFYRCRRCSFIWADPDSLPDEASSRARYELHTNSIDDVSYTAYLNKILDRALEYTREITGRTIQNVVDWGSGPDPVASILLKRRGLQVQSWDPLFKPDTTIKDESAELLLCIEVAEHFTEPRKDFAALFSTLKPGGFALIHTHLVPESDEAFLSWWYKEDPTHVSFYSEKSLELLAFALGLSAPEIQDKHFVFFRKPLPVLVAGASNLDIEARPDTVFIPRDSNPGTVLFSAGGAGRNTAENLVRLHIPVELVSMTGPDAFGQQLRETNKASGIGTTGMKVLKNQSSSLYISILDEQGDMISAVNSMGIYDAVKTRDMAEALDAARTAAEQRSCGITGQSPFSALVMDANLGPELIQFLLDSLPELPAFLDTVSTVKAQRTAAWDNASLLKRCKAIKPNLVEAEAIALELDPGFAAKKDKSVTDIAKSLASSGLSNAYISLGSEGLMLNRDSLVHARVPAISMCSATGAGDALFAGIIRSELLEYPFMNRDTSLLAALAVALINIQEEYTVSQKMDGFMLMDLLLDILEGNEYRISGE